MEKGTRRALVRARTGGRGERRLDLQLLGMHVVNVREKRVENVSYLNGP